MQKNYKRLGDYIQLVDERNKGLKVDNLLRLSISKQFIPSVANTIGTDMENYNTFVNHIYNKIEILNKENQKLSQLKELLLSRLAIMKK